MLPALLFESSRHQGCQNYDALGCQLHSNSANRDFEGISLLCRNSEGLPTAYDTAAEVKSLPSCNVLKTLSLHQPIV